MNLIILTDYFHPIIKSGSIIVGDLANELVKNGHNVTIITFSDSSQNIISENFDNGLKVNRLKSPFRKFGRIGRLFAEQRYSKTIIERANTGKICI